MKKIIDAHAHVIPEIFLKLIQEGAFQNVSLEYDNQFPVRVRFAGGPHPLNGLFCSVKESMAFCDSHGIDCQVISVAPRLFFYDQPEDRAAEFCVLFNDELIERARNNPERQVAMGGVPLQNPLLAAQELERIHKKGVRSVQIGTSVNGKNLSDPEFMPFFKMAEEKEILIMLHPHITNDHPLMTQYHIANLVGNPWQTTVAAENLILSGFFERHPRLQFLLVHGGGFLPYQMGRMEHGYSMRPEVRKNISHSPEYYVQNNFYFDGLTHDAKALEFLIGKMKIDRVVFGTDYPYDMAQYDQVEHVKQMALPDDDVTKFAGATIARLLGLKS